MKSLESIVEVLRKDGRRITAFREAALKIFLKAKRPLSAAEVLGRVTKKTQVHKTTVYRELEILTSLKILTEVDFNDGVTRYELSGEHHHHIVCTNCSKIDSVSLSSDIEAAMKEVSKKVGYKQVSHSLEFFGVCRSCR